MSRLMTKPTNRHVRPAKTQIYLDIRPVWSAFAVRMKKACRSLATHWAHSEDSDPTGRMPRLIWVFAGRTFILLVFSWGYLWCASMKSEKQFPVYPVWFAMKALYQNSFARKLMSSILLMSTKCRCNNSNIFSHPSRKHLHAKVAQILHLKYSKKMGETWRMYW